MSGIELTGVPQSPYVRVARMALEEKGVSYQLVPASPHTPAVDAIHPFGKIPVMRHGDFTLFESKAIAAYIDRAFGGPDLVPREPRAAAVVEQWISAINTSVFPAIFTYLREHIMVSVIGRNSAVDPAVIAESLPSVRKAIEVLEAGEGGKGFLAGGQFTLADIFALPLLTYLYQFPESRTILRDAPNLARYFAAHSKRPSFIATIPPPVNA